MSSGTCQGSVLSRPMTPLDARAKIRFTRVMAGVVVAVSIELDGGPWMAASFAYRMPVRRGIDYPFQHGFNAGVHAALLIIKRQRAP